MTSPRLTGAWTKTKLEMLQRYLDAYTTALKNTKFKLTYVDAFAGSGTYSDVPEEYAEFGELQKGSARIALEIADKPFDRLVFIEKEKARVAELSKLKVEFPGRQIEVYEGDANGWVPPYCGQMPSSERAVVFLDPFATAVHWNTIEAIAATRKMDCWILFPLMAVTRMMDKDRMPTESLQKKLDSIFGGREYWEKAYKLDRQYTLGGKRGMVREPASSIAGLYRARLKEKFVAVAPTSRTLRNSKNSPLFELYFAASNRNGASIAIGIAEHILLKEW